MAGASDSAAMPSSASRAACSNSGCSPLPPSAAAPSPSRPRRLRRPPRRPRRRPRPPAAPGATTIAPPAPPSAAPSPSLGLAAGLSRGFRTARAVSGLVPFAGMAQVVLAGLRGEVRVVFRRKCSVVALCVGDLAALAATAAAPPASPLAALAAIGALVLSLILVGFALGLPVRLRRGRDALLGLGHVVRLEVVFVLLIVDRGGNGGRPLGRPGLCVPRG